MPWGLELRSSETAGILRVNLGLPGPLDLGALRVGATAGLELGPTGALAPTVSVSLDLTDAGTPVTVLGGLDVALGSTISAAARLPLGGSTLTIPLLPVSGGLGGLAGAAARALPLALDALTHVGTFGAIDVGAAIAALADALDLRTGAGPTFDLVELEQLADQPAAQLATRLSRAANRSDLAAALRLLDPLLPGSIGGTGAVVDVVLSRHLTVSVDLAGAVPAVCLRATDVRPVAELSIGGELCFGDGGVRSVRAGVEVADPDLLRLAGTSLLPGVSFAAGVDTSRPAGLIELALWTAPPAATGREAVVVRFDLAAGVAVRWRTGAGSGTPADVEDPVAAALGLAAPTSCHSPAGWCSGSTRCGTRSRATC